jgi:hypothetical protein
MPLLIHVERNLSSLFHGLNGGLYLLGSREKGGWAWFCCQQLLQDGPRWDVKAQNTIMYGCFYNRARTFPKTEELLQILPFQSRKIRLLGSFQAMSM